jgi:predicted ArsR family transcriptional regulator
MPHDNRRKRQPIQSLLGTTRGKILVMLCHERLTVVELADRLDLTANAVRAQLERLERDGFVAKAGSRRGVRRPHVEYQVTPAGLELFPRAYEPVLVEVLNVLVEQSRSNASRGVLLEAGRRLMRQHLGELRGRSPRQRLAETMNKLNGSSLGIEVREESGKHVIRSCSCPIASVVAARPEVCAVFATVLGEVVGAIVSESCDKGESPRCRFSVT